MNRHSILSSVKNAAAFIILACFISFRTVKQKRMIQYNNILLLQTHYTDTVRLATACFVSPDVLITVNTERTELHTGIEAGLPQAYIAGKQSISFGQEEFEISDYTDGKDSNLSVRIIRLLNRNKSSFLYQGHFSVIPFDAVPEREKLILSGWQDAAIAVKPEDSFEDVLKRNAQSFHKRDWKNISPVQLNGYKHFNGSPLWYKKGKQIFITGMLAQGLNGNKILFFDEEVCKRLVKWISVK